MLTHLHFDGILTLIAVAMAVLDSSDLAKKLSKIHFRRLGYSRRVEHDRRCKLVDSQRTGAQVQIYSVPKTI